MSHEESHSVSIVIPVLNEEKILEPNLNRLASFFDSLLGNSNNTWNFIIVDNGSVDSTPTLLQNAKKKWPSIQIVNLPNPNYGAALKAGLLSATSPWVYLLDIEQWDLPFIAWSWGNRNDYEMFIASKRADPTICFQTPYRKLLSCGLNALLQIFLGFTGSDTHGPKLLNRQSLEPIIQKCQLDRGQFDTELVLRALRKRFRIVEVPVLYKESRPNRNWMIKKIVWNILALRRLISVMKNVPSEGLIRYRRFSREDIIALVEKQYPFLPLR